MLVMPLPVDHQRNRGRFVTFAGSSSAAGAVATCTMLYLACAAFVVYFCLPMIEGVIK